MIERSEQALSVPSQGTIGLSACRHGCKGCPQSRNEDAMIIRLVGTSDRLLEKIKELPPHRVMEWASGEFPPEPDLYRRLKDAGLNRIVMPLFDTEDPVALASIETVTGAGLPILFLSSEKGREEIRKVIRFSWKYHASLSWIDSTEPPCFSESREIK